jgi:hypothetical protein
MQVPPAVAGVGVLWYERSEDAGAWMWMDWPPQLENMAGGGMDKDSKDRRTMTGLVWPRQRRRARWETIVGRGERGEDGKSGASWRG